MEKKKLFKKVVEEKTVVITHNKVTGTRVT